MGLVSRNQTSVAIRGVAGPAFWDRTDGAVLEASVLDERITGALKGRSFEVLNFSFESCDAGFTGRDVGRSEVAGT